MSPNTAGIHHVTAIAGEPQRNLDLYEGVLGLRLVKKTVKSPTGMWCWASTGSTGATRAQGAGVVGSTESP
jgi:catechol 2,3-dioxygenase-like lactoylglutathione lyase family enzyme